MKLVISRVGLNLKEPIHSSDVLAVATVVFCDAFAVHGIKIVQAPNNRGLAVVMPNVPRTVACIDCRMHNNAKACFCNWCGTEQPKRLLPGKLFISLAHPVDETTRLEISELVLNTYQEKIRRSHLGKAPAKEIEDVSEDKMAQ